MHNLPKVLFFYHGRAGTKLKAPGIFPHARKSLSGGAHLDIHISLPLVFLHFFLAKGPWAHLPSLTAYLFPSSCSRNDNSHNQDHPRQLGDSSLGAEGGEHRARCTGWKYFEEHWIKWCWYSSVRLKKKSGVLFTSGFLPWGDGRAERKVGQEGATCLDFTCIPIHASLRTSCPLCVQNLVNFPEAEVSLDSFNMLGCRHHGLF